MELEKLCLVWFLLQVQSILTNSSSIVYTVECSTITLTFEHTDKQICFGSYRNGKYFRNYLRLKEDKYDIRIRPSIIEYQIINGTTSDTGFYWLNYTIPELRLTITNKSCQSRAPRNVCVVNGSSVINTYIIEASVCYAPGEEWHSWRRQHRIFSNVILHVDFYIYNATLEDEGHYIFDKIFDAIKLQVSKLWFINQTDLKTIVGQEGEALIIICSSEPEQYITELMLKSNGTVKAIGDNQTVSYSFIPDKTDHLTKYQCLDSKHSSIMIEVELSIQYAPAVTIRFTNGSIECDCDGVPPIYNVFRLDQISKYSELVRSVNLDNETFLFNTDIFPYQRNGRYMCVVSNGIPGINGKKLQNSTTHVIYEGPPVFAKENRYVKIGKVRKSSISMSFLVYSYPEVEEIFLEKKGRMSGQKIKMNTYVLKSALLYNDLDKETRVLGYDILIESHELNIDDFQAYIITVTNRLGASDYHFEIIKKEDRIINQRERKYVFTICILGAVLFGLIIVHIGLCVKRARRSIPIHSNMNEDRTYHAYDEIGSISYDAVRNLHPSDTNDNQEQNLTHLHAAHISNEVNVQSTGNNSTELDADFHNNGFSEIEAINLQEQQMSTDDTIIIDEREQHEQSIDQKSQISSDFESESSETVMVGNVGEGYEHPYQTVLQDQPEGHQYTQITIERNTSIVSADSDSEMQILEHSLTKEAVYINLQF